MERVEALRRLEILDTPPEECFDRLTRLATRVLGVPVALVSLIDEDRQFFKSQVGLAEPWATRRETPLTHSFCRHVVADNSVLKVEDARRHPFLHDNLAIPELGVVAYLGIPLTNLDGCALGSFCAIDSSPRAWTDEQEAIMRDLAESVVTELELRRLSRELHQLNQEKNQLLGMAAHDLRTPLCAISGYASLVLGSQRLGPLTDAQRNLLERSRRAAGYMVSLIDNLLDVAKIESGELRLKLERLDLVEVMQEALAMTSVLAEEKSIVLRLQVPPQLEWTADGPKLQQVLLNLLGNAIKFSPPDRQVWLRLENVQDEAVISVIDEGQGIPESEQSCLFKAFTKTSVRATGGSRREGFLALKS